jgi:hypothetical protein
MSKIKNWAVNIFILIVITGIMLFLAEIAMRWLDGYGMSSFELKQDINQTQPAE